jgi:hypothetical protein
MSVSTPPAGTVNSAVAGSPTASHTAQVMLGRSFLTGVILGQDSVTFNRKKGFGFDSYYTGEIVSMARSDGRRTIGQILSVSPVAISVDMGGGARKEVPAAEIPYKISKLLGLYYLAA